MLVACRQIADSLKLVVLDVRMPGPSPLQMYQQIHEIRPELPVLFCSAADPDDPGITAINKHGLKLLPKPYQRSDLRQAIQNVMG
jgi:DNA-binding NtrC family response regulator